MLLEAPQRAGAHLLHQPVDNFDTGEVALVNGAIEALAGERLLMERAVGVAVKKAAMNVLELVHPLDGTADEGPGELLVGQPFAALDGVHKMALDRVAFPERHIVAALDHTRAAAFAHEPLDGNRYVEIGALIVGVKRGEEPRAARAEDENVGAHTLHAVTSPLHLEATEFRSHRIQKAPSLEGTD